MTKLSANRIAKEAVVQTIQEKMDKAKSVVLVNYIGLNVEEATQLRNQFREANVEYKVLKNSMISRAAKKLGIEGLDDFLVGTTALAFSYDDPTTAPRIIKDFIKKTKKTEIKCGTLGKILMQANQIEQLANLPTKEVVIAMLLGVLNGSARSFVSVLSAVPHGLVTALDAIKEQKESA